MKIRYLFMKIAMFVVPIYTVLLAINASIFEYNLSIVGNYFDMRISFVLWGIMTGTFLLFFIKDLFKKAKYTNFAIMFFANLGCVLFMASIVIPYLPDVFPFASWLHEAFAFISPFMLLASISIFVSKLVQQNPIIFKRSMILLRLIVLFSLALLMLFKFVNSALEIFVLISTILFLKDLENRIEQNNIFNDNLN